MSNTRLHPPSSGFTLIEALIGVALAAVILTSTLLLIRPAADVGALTEQRGEMQQNARVSINSIARELSIAGTGLPLGGIQLPAGEESQPARFACDFSACYLENSNYPDDRLYSVTPGVDRGPTLQGIQTDVVTMVYRDESYQLDQYPLTEIAADGAFAKVDASTVPPITDPGVGVKVGDVLVLCNVNGCAAAVSTGIEEGTKIRFGINDPLRFNQQDAEYGNVKALANPGSPGVFPPTRAFRVNVVTYFIDGSDQDNPRLMRQVNAQPPEPVAEVVEDLQLTYDIFDDDTSMATSGLADANNLPNQIRKINISVGVRSPGEGLFGRDFDRTVLFTSVSARNLVFRDRYE